MVLRVLDIIFSSLGLVVFSPLLVPITILLRLTGEGEIFFSQPRIGKDGKIFNLLKFATMLKDSPNIGTGTVTTQGDPRILPVGHFLRKLSGVTKGATMILFPAKRLSFLSRYSIDISYGVFPAFKSFKRSVFS